MSNPKVGAPGGPKLSQQEYIKMLTSKNPLTQLKLFRKIMPVFKNKRINWFKLNTVVFASCFVLFGIYTRNSIRKLKNEDYAIFLADAEQRRLTEERLNQ